MFRLTDWKIFINLFIRCHHRKSNLKIYVKKYFLSEVLFMI